MMHHAEAVKKYIVTHLTGLHQATNLRTIVPGNPMDCEASHHHALHLDNPSLSDCIASAPGATLRFI